MPLTRISLKKGKTPEYHKAITEGIYQAMRDTFDVPEDDRFMTISEHSEDMFDFGKSYMNIDRSDDFIIIQITANNTRNVNQKRALYAQIAANLTVNPGLRPEDIFINLTEVPKENWSFGNGIAQYGQPSAKYLALVNL